MPYKKYLFNGWHNRKDKVYIILTEAKAFVFFDWLARFNEELYKIASKLILEGEREDLSKVE